MKGMGIKLIRLGETQKLTIVKKVEFGVYLAPSAEMQEERVLLPAKQVPADSKIGEEISVIINKDYNARLIATNITHNKTIT